MRLLVVLLILAAVLAGLTVLLTVAPLRVFVEYEAAGLLLQLRLGPFKIPIVRRETPEQKAARARKKAKKAEKRVKKKQTKKQKPKPPKDPEKQKAQRRLLAGLGRQALEELTRKRIPLDRLWLDVTFGGEDPAKTALLFGGVHSALGLVWPAAEQFVEVRDRRIRSAVDFTLSATRVDYFCLIVPLPLSRGLSLGFRLLGWLIRTRRAGRAEKRATQKAAPAGAAR